MAAIVGLDSSITIGTPRDGVERISCNGSLDALYVQNTSWVMSSATRALMGLISTTEQLILQTDAR